MFHEKVARHLTIAAIFPLLGDDPKRLRINATSGVPNMANDSVAYSIESAVMTTHEGVQRRKTPLPPFSPLFVPHTCRLVKG